MPVVCLNGSLIRALIVRQSRIAESMTTTGRPRRPSRGASRVICPTGQISDDPRFFREAVWPDRRVVR